MHAILIMIKNYFLALLTVVFHLFALGQDSLQLDKSTNDYMFKLDSLKIADSLDQSRLLEELNQLSDANQQEKDKLQAKLDSLTLVKELRNLKLKSEADSLRLVTVGYPVLFFGDTLFAVYTKLGPIKPAERAKRIQEKLESLVEANDFYTDSLRIEDSEETADLYHGQEIIFSVSDKDAFWLEQTKIELADTYQMEIAAAYESYREAHSLRNILKRIGFLILALLGLVLTIYFVNRGLKWSSAKLVEKSDKFVRPIKVKNLELLTVEREKQLILWLLKVFRIVVILAVLYIFLPIIFSIFPATESLAHNLIGYITTPLKNFGMGFINFIPELISITVIILITRYFIRVLRAITTEIATGKLEIKGFYPDWAKPTFNLVKGLLYAIAFIMIFPYLPGSDSPIFQGVTVFFGLLISLGSSSAIGNMIAGLVITYMRPFKKGDRVKIGDTTGDVIEKTMLVTRLRTIKNEEITIPNSAILNGSTTNYTASLAKNDVGLILYTTVTIGYDVPWREVHKMLVDAALRTDLINKEPLPFVLQTSLDDFYVSYQLNAYTSKPKFSAKIYSDLHANIQDCFNEANVEILSPHYRAQRDGSASTIPTATSPKND